MSESGPGKNQTPKLESKELTAEHAAQLLFFSFRFSQGADELQESIIEWLKKRYSYNIYNMVNEVRAKLKIMTASFFQKPGIHTNEITPEDTTKIDGQISDAIGYFTDPEPKKYLYTDSKDEILADIIWLTIERDYKFLVEEGGRPVQRNRMQSFIVSYAIEGKTTGIPEYDEMFKKMGELMKKVPKVDEEDSEGFVFRGMSTDTLTKLEEIKKVHKED